MPLFSDFGNPKTRQEDVAAVTANTTPSESPISRYLKELSVENLLKSTVSPIQEYLQNFNSNLGQQYPSLKAPQGENFLQSVGRLLPQTVAGPSTYERYQQGGILPAAADVMTGGPLARGTLGALGSLASTMGNTANAIDTGTSVPSAGLDLLGSTLNIPGDVARKTSEEFLSKPVANAPLFNLPVVGDVSTAGLADVAGGLVAPPTALERAGGALLGRGVKAAGQAIGEKTLGEVAGAGVGGTLGYLNPPSNPLSTEPSPAEPTFEQRVTGAIAGGVLGSQAPRALRAARGLEAPALKIPGAGMLSVQPNPNVNVVEQVKAAIGQKLPAPEPTDIDKVFNSKLFGIFDKAKFASSWIDRYNTVKDVEDYLVKRGMDPAEATAYTNIRNLAGTDITASEILQSSGFLSSLKSLSPQERTLLSAYRANLDASDKALMIGQRVRNEYLDNRLKGLVNLPEIQTILSASPEGQAFLQGPSSRAFYSLPDQLQSDLAQNVDFGRLLGIAEQKGQTAINERNFGSIRIGDQVIPIRAVAKSQVEQDLDSLAKSPEVAQRIRDANNVVTNLVESTRQRMVNSGLISQDLLDYFRRNFPDYVPIDIIDYIDKKPNTFSQGATSINAQDLIKGLTERGSELNRSDPLASVVNMVNRVEWAANKNAIAQNIASWRQISPEIEQIIREVSPQQRPSVRDVTFKVFENGREKLYAVDRKYENLIRFDKEVIPQWLNTLRILSGSSTLVAGATKYNPGFVAVNAIGDMFTYLTRGYSEGKSLKDMTTNLLSAYGDLLGESGTAGKLGTAAVGATVGSLTAGKAAENQQDPNAKLYAQILGGLAGGVLGYRVPGLLASRTTAAGRTSLQELRRAGLAGDNLYVSNFTPEQILKTALGQPERTSNMEILQNPQEFQSRLAAAMSGLGNVITMPFKPISAVGEAIERAPRLAQYRMERAAGKSIPEATLAARDITIDFDRAGSLARVINTIVPFFNVGVQGFERFLNRDLGNFRTNPTRAAASFLSAVVIPGLAVEAYNRTYFPREYADVPDYLKQTGFVFVLGQGEPTDTGKPAPPKFVWIPTAPGLRAVQAVVSEVVNTGVETGALQGLGLSPTPNGPPPRNWKDILKTVTNAALPVQVDSPLSLVSPLGKTAFEITTNKDVYRGLSIVPDPLHALPPEEQVRPWNTAISRALGKALNSSPAKIEYAILSMTGGVGKTLLGAGDLAAKAMGAPGAESTQQLASQFVNFGPDSLFGRFYREKGEQINQSIREETKASLPGIVRDALGRLRADPAYQALSPSQQAEESRRLSLAVERLVLETVDPLVFEAPSATGGAFRYLTSNSYADDVVTADAVQTYEAWLRNPSMTLPPTPEVMRRALMAVKNPVYAAQEKQNTQLRERALAPLRLNPMGVRTV